MEQQRCKDCQYFCQHYVYYHGRYSQAGYGHCINPGIKYRRPEAKACEKFQIATERENPKADREDTKGIHITINCTATVKIKEQTQA